MEEVLKEACEEWFEREFKNLEEIVELCKDEINNNDENTHATLDLEDLKELKCILVTNKELKEALYEAEAKFGEVYGALFLIVRNRVVQPKGRELGKSDKEITKMTIDTINAYIQKHADYGLVMDMINELEDDGDHIPHID